MPVRRLRKLKGDVNLHGFFLRRAVSNAGHNAEMKRHATEHVDSLDRTLCGKSISQGGESSIQIDNCDPDCGSCLRVIRSRCSVHNVARCKVCPRAWNIGAA